MYRKNIYFKPVFFKVFFTYLVIYVLSLIFRNYYDIESLENIQYKYLISLNMICIFLGIPLTTVFDFILIKLFGFYYILFFSPFLTILSVIQVLILRKFNLKFFNKLLIFQKPKNNHLFKFLENVSFRSSYILIIRSFPILPHLLGSYIIASSKIKKRFILINTFFGTIFYYSFIFLIIDNT